MLKAHFSTWILLIWQTVPKAGASASIRSPERSTDSVEQMAASALPTALRGITATKIIELKKQRTDFEDAKAAIQEEVRKYRDTGDVLGQTQALIDGVCRLEGVYLADRDSPDDEDLDLAQTGIAAAKLINYSRLLEQSRNDPAVPKSVIKNINRDLIKILELKSIQHQHAELYAQLVTEYVSVDSTVSPGSGDSDATQFEAVGREEMHEQRKQWESNVFSTTDVDQVGIEAYLTNLFTTKSHVKREYETLRKRLRAFSINIATEEIFQVDSLKAHVKGVLATDLLNDEKRTILKTFASNEAVLKEVADVLSMRFKSLELWQYTTDNGAITVEQRRQLNGKYRFYLDEDVLDALFIHAIGMKWAVEIRAALNALQSSHAWSRDLSSIPIKDRQRREWFLGSGSNSGESVVSARNKNYAENYFMTQLPETVGEGPRAYDDSDGGHNDSVSARKGPLQTKHSLLHLLIAEATIARYLHPTTQHTVIRSDFKWFGPSLPHTSIFKVLEFLGVTPLWLSFFRKFLATPIRFAQDGPDGAVQVRTRGIPMSMALADVLGEAVLFVMDFAVNSAAKGNMYRLHDDFWYWNDKDACCVAWRQMKTFAQTMGIEFNEEKTGSVVFPQRYVHETESSDDERSTDSKYAAETPGLPKGDVRWGFLKLDPTVCRFRIDQDKVDEHIKELRLQLAAHSTSVFGYIQAYNSYVARFFSNNFGKPSFGFGNIHVDEMIDTLRRIHEELYPQGRVADHLSTMVEERFDVKASDIPDGFWFFPVANGGMEIQNPVISLLDMREDFRRSPDRILQKAMDDEDADYVSAKLRYERSNTGTGLAGGNYELKFSLQMTGSESFMSQQEFLKYREERSARLLWAYRELLTIPTERSLVETPEIGAMLRTLDSGRLCAEQAGLHPYWSSMSPYWKHIVSCFGKGIYDKFGSLKLVEPAQVPLGVVSVMKSSKVKWHG